MRMHKWTPVFVAITIALTCSQAGAQGSAGPIPEKPSIVPQIELDGTGIATLNYQTPRPAPPPTGSGSTTDLDFADSSLLLGISQRLYHGGIGSLVLGTVTTGESEAVSKTGLLLSQLYLDYQTQPFEAYIGRANTPTHLFDFPTLRGDDLNEFVNLPNPFSNGAIADETRYSNVAAVEWNSHLRNFFNLHVQHLLQTAAPGAGQTGINSYGLTFRYEAPPALESIVKIPFWGLGYEHQTIGSAQGGPADVLYGGIIYNIAPDPIHRFDLRLLDIYSFSNGLHSFTGFADTYRAAANSVALSLRYLYALNGVPGYEVALTAGFRNYARVHDANTFALALTGAKRLGEGFDLVLQYIYQHRGGAYASAVGQPKDENRFEIGFVFHFQNILNQHIGPRRTLQNLQHQYIPE
jgi:hypothetical protein